MGCAQSTEQQQRNDEIDRRLHADKDNSQASKLLLLGAGESGKSTFAKQIRCLHMNGFTDDERLAYRPSIAGNVIYCARALLKGCHDLGIEVGPEESVDFLEDPRFDVLHGGVPTGTAAPEEDAKQATPCGALTDVMTKHVQAVWAHAGAKAAWERHSQFQIYDCAAYLFDNVERIAAADYVPTVADIIISRTKTTGVSEVSFTVQGSHFRLVDVGGQKSERKKWMRCFDDVQAVLFVVAASEYDQTLYEDNTTNRMKDSLKLFADICNNKFFANTAIVVFFNKSDLFAEKLKKIDLSVTFPEYSGGSDYDKACEFLQNKFLALNENAQKPVYVHFTNATNPDNVKLVFESVRDTVLHDILKE
eukprot:TRINITY_DN4246_c0_g1_i2.p1 TRINITY_DN4246_c0_g1~~TRINITY_DN4246_c0_g1_i2.p1  ORF type:complete len:388 (-),score=120.61 TRINITY_DN4246_c0_g1_i2:68-1156(-)